MKLIDDFLNGITMYRLMFQFLVCLVLLAVILSFFGFLSFSPINLILSASFLTLICWVTNRIFARLYKAPTNLESVYITALILSLIITPTHSFNDLVFFSLVAILAVASKYILAINKKHIFNPAAVSVALTALIIHSSASWWIGTLPMTLPVLLGGLLIVRKIRKFSMVLSFFLTSLLVIAGSSFLKGTDPLLVIQKVILESPLLFFALVMLTEPQTTPPTKFKQILYGVVVGSGFSFLASEVALLLGNTFSYLISPKGKLLLRLKEKIQMTPDTYEFVFSLDKKFSFSAGQYLEWTLGYKNPDSRGNRRYFTIASSPTEENLRLGIKFYPNSSTFKKALVSSNPDSQIVASQLSGEFTLLKDLNKKLCFIAGGIGITPFRSMIKYLIDQNEKRDIILLYSNKTAKEIVYKNIFDEAFKKLEINTIYVNTDEVGYIDETMIKKEVPDFKDRIFYISGPHSMVDAFENTLKKMGLSGNQIKVDFFPGYA